MDDRDDMMTEPSPGPRRRRRASTIVGGILAAGLLGGLFLASLTSAGAQTTTPRTPTAPRPSERPHGPFRGPGPGRFGEPGFGFDGFGPRVLHGEFTAKSPSGAYQTLAVQTGQVTAVSSSSITLRSEDGFTRTYAVDTNTMVNAGRDGIGSVTKGDSVHVVAKSNGDTATAVHIVDATNVRRSVDGWLPPGRFGPPAEAPVPSGA